MLTCSLFLYQEDHAGRNPESLSEDEPVANSSSSLSFSTSLRTRADRGEAPLVVPRIERTAAPPMTRRAQVNRHPIGSRQPQRPGQLT